MFEIYFCACESVTKVRGSLRARACTRVNIMPAGNYAVFYVSLTHVCAYLCAYTHLRAESIHDVLPSGNM